MVTPYGFVYLVRNNVSGKVYIGQTARSIKARWAQHISRLDDRTGRNSRALADAIRSYGVEAFAVTELGRATNQDELDQMEQDAIRLHNSADRCCGYNLALGGKGGGRWTEERRRSIEGPLNHRFGTRASEATRHKLSQAHSGANNGFFGRSHSAGSRQLMRAAKLGTIHNDATRAKQSAAHKGRVKSPETIQKLREAALRQHEARRANGG